MKLFRSKMKFTVAVMIVFAMLLQIVGPAIPQSYAESNDDFRINSISVEDGKARVDWEFDFYAGISHPVYEFDGEFTLSEEDSGVISLDNNIKIGSYIASEDGKISVTIAEGLEDLLVEEKAGTEDDTVLDKKDQEDLPGIDGDQEGSDIRDENKSPEEGEDKQENGTGENDDSVGSGANDEDEAGKDGSAEDEEGPKDDKDDLKNENDENHEENTDTEPKETEEDKTLGRGYAVGQVLLAASVPDLSEVFEKDEPITLSGSFEIKGVLPPSEDEVDYNFAQFITSVDIKHIDAEGNEIDGKFTKDSRLKIEYFYGLPDNEDNVFVIDTSQEYHINIPSEIEIIDQQIIELYHTGDKDILLATVTIDTDNSAKVVFDENVNKPEYAYDRGGRFSITSVFGEIKVDEDGNGNIEFEVGQDKDTIKIEFEKEQTEVKLGLKKSGYYDNEKNEIVWTIDIEPSSTPPGIEISDLLIRDILVGDNHKLFEASNPSIYPEGVGSFSEEAGNLSFTFNESVNRTPGEKYTISFRTKADISNIEDNKTVVFKNHVEADYKVDGKEQPTIKTDAEVSVYVDYIGKSGRFIKNETGNIADDRIEWTITINSNYLTLESVKIVDELDKGLALDEDSLKIDPEAPEGSGWEYEENTLTYSFGATINRPYTLKFKTKIIDPEAYKGNEQVQYPNQATITWDNGSETDGVGGSGVGVNTSLLEKHSGGDIDYVNHILKWKLVVNRNKIKIENPLVTDILPEGLKYVDGSFKVDGVEATDGVSYDKETRELTYDFTGYKDANGNIDTMHTLYFETQVVDRNIYGSNDNTWFTNRACLTGDNIKASCAQAGQEYRSRVIDKVVEYDYTSHMATWTISVNQNKMEINNARVVDKIGEDHEFIGQVKIDGVDANEGASAEEKDSYYFDTDTNTFTYNFPAVINEGHTISFVTRIKDPFEFFKGNESKKISNTAILYGDDVKDGGAEDSVSKDIGNTVVKKDGKHIKDDYKIDWEVVVNQNRVRIPGAILEDILPEGLSLDTSSVKLFKMNLSQDGSLAVGEEVNLTTSNIEYDANTRLFVFKFNGTIEDAYMLKFSTDIDMELGSNKTYVNSIKFKGSGLDEDHTSNAIEVKYTTSEGEAWGSSRGSITINKVDEEGKKLLSGAIFELLDADGNIIKVSSPTDEDGRTVFRGLHFGIDYKLREKLAPEGYAISSQVYEFRLDKEVENQKHIEYNFVNTKIKGDIEFTKYGEDMDLLPGAEFTLYNADDEEFKNPIVTAISGEDGKVRFENIAFGSYKIKETKAPRGYLLTDVVLEVTISEDGKTVEATPNSIVNTMIRGNFRLLKVRRNTSRPLAGAEITIYKMDGTRIDARTTGEDGYALFENLPYGDYYFIETKAPSGYVRNNAKQYFTIEEEGVTLEKIFENRLIPTDPEDPDRPDRPDEPDTPNTPNTPETPDIPETPETPDEPDTEINPSVPDGGVDGKGETASGENEETIEIDSENPKGNVLPKTGELNSIVFYMAGIILIGLGLAVRRRIAKN